MKTKFESIDKKTFQVKLKMFFFPLWPFNVFKNTRILSMLAILIALRIVLQYAVIHIPVINTSFSLAWTPLIIVGWLFGPIVGLFTGAVTDTITYFLKPTSVWFWLYAIQEPIVGFLAGIFGSLWRIRKFYFINKNIKYKPCLDLIFNQVFVFASLLISTIVIIYWSMNNTPFEGKSKFELFFIENGKYIVIAVNLFFFIIVESTIILMFKKYNRHSQLFIWVINLTIAITIIFSFILGPISAAEYYKYVYNKESPYVIKYGLIFYLIPRVIKESLKLPLQNIVLIILIPLTQYHIDNIKKNLRLTWQS